MLRLSKKLTSQLLKNCAAGKYCDGDGLWFVKNLNGSGKWFFRFVIHKRRREMGLGAFPSVTLKEARTIADEWRALVRKGIDPINERQRLERVAQQNMHLLKDVAADTYAIRKAQLKGDGKDGRWFSPILHHILPRLGDIPITQISQIDIRDTLLPIWHFKAVTAEKALTRLGICFRHASALGLDVDPHLIAKARQLLGEQNHKTINIPAIHWRDLPHFYQSLRDSNVTENAMKLLILTGVRSKPLRNIQIDQICDDIWTIPAELMKGKKNETQSFRVPLSNEALRVIRKAEGLSKDGFLFPSVRKGVISDATMIRYMSRRGMNERPHGFRSSLRGWLAEATDAPYEVAETCLAHAVGNKASRSYPREDFFEKRKVLMQSWAQFLTTS